jgi:hypothetical protein
VVEVAASRADPVACPAVDRAPTAAEVALSVARKTLSVARRLAAPAVTGWATPVAAVDALPTAARSCPVVSVALAGAVAAALVALPATAPTDCAEADAGATADSTAASPTAWSSRDGKRLGIVLWCVVALSMGSARVTTRARFGYPSHRFGNL